MGEPEMELGERELEKIGEYVKSHLPQWLDETGAAGAESSQSTEDPSTEGARAAALHKRELDILERIVRIEDELKNLREVMEERFEAQQNLMEERFRTVYERFRKMDERFEAMQNQMDKRFEAQQNLMEERFRTVDERFSKMDERFEAIQNQMNQRFEAQQKQMDRRFDAMDKRFSFNQRILGIGFTAIALLIVVLNYLG